MMSNFFARMVSTENRLLKRSCESLLGICTGLLADNHLSDNEIHFLDTWLADHDDIANTWPGEILVKRIRSVLADGIIDEDEREYLRSTLSDLIGGVLEETGATFGISTQLPLDSVDDIQIEDHSFCFTGNFLYGTRAACHKATEDRAGKVSKSVLMSLDYLVIGTMTSREWAHTSHGRKIEKAMHYKSKGKPIAIISEEQWIQAI